MGVIDPCLSLGRPRLGTASQPLDLRFHAVLQSILLLCLRLQVRFPALQKLRVASLHAQQPVRIDTAELDHLGRHVLEEVAVMADHDARESRLVKQGFEPHDSREIQVIRGLVEQQHIRTR